MGKEGKATAPEAYFGTLRRRARAVVKSLAGRGDAMARLPALTHLFLLALPVLFAGGAVLFYLRRRREP